MLNRIGSTAKAGVGLALAAGVLAAVAMPVPAKADGGAFAAGLIGGTALGTMFGIAVSHPPPPAYYPPPPPPPPYYAPATETVPPPEGPGPRCARWRSTPAPDGSPVCLRYFPD